MPIDAGQAKEAANDASIELESIRRNQRAIDNGTASQRIIEKSMGVAITSPPNNGRDPKSGTHFHAGEHPGRLCFSGRKGPDFVRLKLDELDLVGRRIVEPQRERGCSGESAVRRVPADAFDPCDSGAAYAFDRHVSDAIECAPGTSETVVGRINSSRECSTAVQATVTSPETVSYRE